MIDYLEQLVEAGEFAKAIELGEQLLKDRENTPGQLLVINCSILRAQCALGQLESALGTGELCVDMAQEMDEWDLLGVSSLYLGVALGRLNRHREAVSRFRRYIGLTARYSFASRYEVMAFYNLGVSLLALGEAQCAAQALTLAHDQAISKGNTRALHGIRQALIDARISISDINEVSRLVVKCGHFLRNHPHEPMHRISWLYHMELRARFAMLTGRRSRARLLLVRGLTGADGEEQHQTLLHMLLARLASDEGVGPVALGHAVAAQVLAKQGGRTDIETEAIGLLYSVSDSFPTASEEMDAYYVSMM